MTNKSFEVIDQTPRHDTVTATGTPGDAAVGLTTDQAHVLLQEVGPNVLPEKPNDPVWLVFGRQFLNPFVYILLAAAVVSLALAQHVNAVCIVLVMLIDATIGAIQEYSAQRSASALNKMVPHVARVMRDGQKCEIPASELVPGDLLFVESGDRAPADMKLIEDHQLSVDESILTGESEAVTKVAGYLAAEASADKQTSGEIFAGTMISYGRGMGTVTATGIHTQIGKIAVEVSSSTHSKPPLLQRMEEFTKRISMAVVVIILVLFAIALLRGDNLSDVFLVGVALGVSAIPEGLPAAITVALAIGMRRMAKVNVIIRRLVAVESLGSCTCIASDKTGTLTINKMTVKRVLLPNGQLYVVSTDGQDQGIVIEPQGDYSGDFGLAMLGIAGALANEATLGTEPDAKASGDSVDVAFLHLADKMGLKREELHGDYPTVKMIPYESDQAFSACICEHDGSRIVFVKGACDVLLPMCSHLYDGARIEANQIVRQTEELAGQSYRVLAVAYGRVDSSTSSAVPTFENLCFAGMVGIIDPIRPEAIEAVKQCHTANIRLLMITGDHPKTAGAIACELGIMSEGDTVVTGQVLSEASTEQQAELVRSTNVFARVSPTDKLLIVQHLIDQGEYVAVTGDGVNDAPALKKAHVGVAMGQRGTDVARENADIVLTDDNFASVVRGVEQGRVVYNNIRKVVFLLISTGAAEITLFLLSIMTGLPLPLFAVQVLWLNLVTNGIQDVALAFEPAEGNELSRPPRAPNESIFNRIMVERVVVNALVMGLLAFGVFVCALQWGLEESSARNVTLLLMVLFENVHVLNSRSETTSIFKHPFFGNTFLLVGMLCAQGIHIVAMHVPVTQTLLGLEPVSPTVWFALLGVASILIMVDEVHKYVMTRRRGVS